MTNEEKCAEAQALIDTTILEFLKSRKRLPTVVRISSSLFQRFVDVSPDNPAMVIDQAKVYEGVPFVVDPDLDEDSIVVGDSH